MSENTIKLDIIMNTDCNLNCKYCFDNQRNKNKVLTSSKLMEVLYDLDNYIDDKTHLIITLFGGEITIHNVILSEILETLDIFIDNHQYLRSIYLMITSNGLVISDKIIQFINNNNNKINTSAWLAISTGFTIDDHNILRGNTFDIVKNNIIYYYRNTNKKIILKIALSNYAINNPNDHYTFFELLKDYSIYDIFYIDDGFDMNLNSYKNFLIWYKSFLLNSLKSKDWASIGWDWIFNYIKENTLSNINSKNIVIDPNGNIHQSHLTYFYNIDNYKNISELINTTQRYKISANFICEYCRKDIKKYCNSFKIENLHAKDADYNKICEITKINIRFALDLIKDIIKYKNDGFLKYQLNKGYDLFKLYENSKEVECFIDLK